MLSLFVFLPFGFLFETGIVPMGWMVLFPGVDVWVEPEHLNH